MLLLTKGVTQQEAHLVKDRQEIVKRKAILIEYYITDILKYIYFKLNKKLIFSNDRGIYFYFFNILVHLEVFNQGHVRSIMCYIIEDTSAQKPLSELTLFSV